MSERRLYWISACPECKGTGAGYQFSAAGMMGGTRRCSSCRGTGEIREEARGEREDDGEPLSREYLVSLPGWDSDYDIGHFWVAKAKTEAGRIEVMRNSNSDDPRISWGITIWSMEGWHAQGFVQTRRTFRRLCEALGVDLGERVL